MDTNIRACHVVSAARARTTGDGVLLKLGAIFFGGSSGTTMKSTGLRGSEVILADRDFGPYPTSFSAQQADKAGKKAREKEDTNRQWLCITKVFSDSEGIFLDIIIVKRCNT